MVVIWQRGEDEFRAVAMGRRGTTPQQGDDVGRTGTAALHLHLLGGFRVAVGARVVAADEWRLLKARALVKLLALAPRHRLAREQAMDALWPDADADAARRNLTYALHVARRALDRDERDGAISPSLLRLDQGVLCLAAPGGVRVDAAEFAAAAAAARGADTLPAYQAALARYGGELLPDDRYEDWAAAPRERLGALAQELRHACARLHEAAGDYRQAAASLEAAVTAEPADEAAHAGLMRLHTLLGDRSRAMRQFGQLRERLREALAVAPSPESQRLYDAILARRPLDAAERPPTVQRPTGAPVPTHNLPLPLTSLVGREREIAELRALLERGTRNAERGIWSSDDEVPGSTPTLIPRSAFRVPRLVTLTGAGGVGKTRLALAVAHALAREYPAGRWWVELAALAAPDRDHPGLLHGLVAQALGVGERAGQPPLERIAAALGERAALLILDNCEHLGAACAGLCAALLRRCPGLRILATSRETLRVPGELVWRVPSLPVPPAPTATASLPEVAENPSVRLFLERGRLVQPRLGLTPDNAGAIVELCRRLDGVPLAIELAAARVAALAPAQLAPRLGRMLGVLTDGARTAPSRQRTLRATLDWSYDLLSPAERDLLHRLAVFVGGWTLEAAEAVGGGDDEWGEVPGDTAAASGTGLRPSSFILPAPAVLGLLAALVDKSLVQVEADPQAGTRYWLLEPVRQYAAERLAASEERAAMHERHAAYFLALAEEAAPSLYDGRQVRWLTREVGNLRAALGWYAERGDAEAGLRLAGAMGTFWRADDHAREGWDWLTRAFAARAGAVTPAVRARAHFAAATLADFSLGDFPAAREEAEAALSLYRAAGDQDGVCMALVTLGKIARSCGELALAREYLASALELARSLPGHAREREGLVLALVFLAGVEFDEGSYAAAAALYTEALPLARAAGRARMIAAAASGLVVARLLRGEMGGLRGLLAESTAIFRETGDRPSVAMMLGIGAMLALGEGDAALAARLVGAGERFRATHALPLTAIEAPHYDRTVAAVRAALGAAAFAAAWAAGREWSTDEAIAAASRP